VVQRAKREKSRPERLPKVSDVSSEDDLRLIRDTLRQALRDVAQSEPSKLAPIAKELRAVVEAMNPPAEKPKEASLADQLAAARAARAARAEGSHSSAVSGGDTAG
jgi:hypothetical protein